MKTNVIIVCLALIFSGSQVFAQLTSAEKKEWKKKANQIKEEISCTIEVSDLLERIAAPEQKRDGLDLADYLIKRDEEFGWAITEAGYPVFWDHIVEQY